MCRSGQHDLVVFLGTLLAAVALRGDVNCASVASAAAQADYSQSKNVDSSQTDVGRLDDDVQHDAGVIVSSNGTIIDGPVQREMMNTMSASEKRRVRRQLSDEQSAASEAKFVYNNIQEEAVDKRQAEQKDALTKADASKRDAEARDINYDYIFGKTSDEDHLDEDAFEQAKRDAAAPSADEKAEDLEMSKKLVDILIKEVYDKLMKSGAAVQPPADAASADAPDAAAAPKGKGGKRKGKGKKGKPFRQRRAAPALTGSQATVLDAVQQSLFCHVLKRLVDNKLIDNAEYQKKIAEHVCFDVGRRRRRRETAEGCSSPGCSPVTDDQSVISAEVACPNPAYLKSFPSVEYIKDDTQVLAVSTASFRGTGAYAIDSLQPDSINNNRQTASLQFTFQNPITVMAFRFVQTKPYERTTVSSLTVSLELAGEKDIWTPVLDSTSRQPLVFVVKSRMVQLPKPFTITRLRIYPQSWPLSPDKPVLPFPVFVVCQVAMTTGDVTSSLLPVDRYDSWIQILAAIFAQ